MKNIKKVLGKKVIIGDGAYGSLLQEEISGDFIPEELNLLKPGLIERLHYDYACSGTDFLTTNTFGASPLKLKDVGLKKTYKKINAEAVKIARRIADMKKIWVAGDIGPSGKLIEPLGDLTFDDMMKNYSAQANILEKSGVDFILLETITDIQEFRAAVVGILSMVKIPVLAAMSFTNENLSLSGTDGKAFAITADFVGLSAVGSNCGATLESMKMVMEKIARYSHLPVICVPNAGLPVVENGETIFKVKAKEFADFMGEIYGLGTAVLGSCCGSTPEFTKKLSEKFKNREVLKRDVNKNLILSSRTTIKEVSDKKMFIVGERINPTGRKKLRKELEMGRLTTVRLDAKEQEKYGSDALDINVNLHKLDIDTAKKIIKSVQNMVNIPMVIDSTDPLLIEEFSKLYAGKGIINSISGEKESLQNLLPLVKKYNMAFIAALMDNKGISDSVLTRIKIAKRIAKKVKKYGIPLRNIIFDPLVLNAGAEVEKVIVTLDAIELLKKEFPGNKTIIGLSNISFGLPNRELVDASFLNLAAAKGLDMVIANPLHESIRHQVMVLDFLRTGSRENLALYTEYFSGLNKKKEVYLRQGSENLYDNILEGDSDSARENIKTILDKGSPVEIIERHIIPAMNEVGRRYQEMEYFLPQLIASADVVKAVLPFIKKKLPNKQVEGTDSEVKVLFATVKGDVHDIGKNIVISILESFNFTVIDLGKDVPFETIISETIKTKANVVGLSTLMTTTIPAMLETVKGIKETKNLKNVNIFIGGAVINKSIADNAGALYAKDGLGMVQVLREISK